MNHSAERDPFSHQWLRLIAESAPAVLWTTDEQLRFTSSMGGGLKALGVKPNEAVGLSLYEYFQVNDADSSPESNPAIAAHIRALAGKPSDYEHCWLDRHYQVRVEPLVNADNQEFGCIGLAFDVTERKHAEMLLQETAERFDKAFHSSPVPKMICRLSDAVLVEANRAFLELIETSRGDVMGKSLLDLCIGQTDEMQACLKELQSGQVENAVVNIRFHSKSGTERIVEVSADSLASGEGNILIAVVDHSKQTLVREAQTAELENYVAYSEATPAFLFQTYGPLDGSRMHVGLVSNACEELLGCTAEQIRNNPLRMIDAIHDDDRGEYYSLALKSMAEKSPFQIEVRVIGRGGRQRWLLIHSTPRMVDDETILYDGVAFDISELKRREEMLQERIAEFGRLSHRLIADQTRIASETIEAHKASLAAKSEQEKLKKVLLETLAAQNQRDASSADVLHETVMQGLTGADFAIQSLAAQVSDDELVGQTNFLRSSLQSSHQFALRLYNELNPPGHNESSLQYAIKSYIDERSEVGKSPVKLNFELSFDHTSPVTEQLLLNSLRQGLRLLSEHCPKSTINVRVDCETIADEEISKWIRLTLHSKLEAGSELAKHAELDLLRQQLAVFEGETSLTSNATAGTSLEFRLPNQDAT